MSKFSKLCFCKSVDKRCYRIGNSIINDASLNPGVHHFQTGHVDRSCSYHFKGFKIVWNWKIVKSFINNMYGTFKPILKFDFGSRFDHHWFRHHLLKKESFFYSVEFLQSKKFKVNWFFCSQLTNEFVRPNEADMFNCRTSLMIDFQTKDWKSSALNKRAESGIIIVPVYGACKENMQFRLQTNWA